MPSTELLTEEINAPIELGKSRESGAVSPSVPLHIASVLTSHRFALPDEYGGLQISERGIQHLRELRMVHRGARFWAGWRK